MTTTDKIARYLLPTYARFPITPKRGDGSWLWDENGKRYLDFCSGIATCSLGHGHRALAEALHRQALELTHCSNLYQIAPQADLAEFIVEECVGIPGRVFLCNSGAEAIDGLIKLARRFGHARPDKRGKPRYEVLTFNRSFHGRTLGALSATAQEKIHRGFDPLLPGFRYLDFNDALCLQEAIRPETAAVLLEPIQGEGGVHVAKRDFLLAAARLCREHDLLLLFDEVQCGFGRSGDLMGWRSIDPDLRPDAISWAKGMGGGFPVGAFWVADRFIVDDTTPLFSVMDAGSHGSTFGGNFLACAAAHTVLRTIKSDDLPRNAREQEQVIRAEISSWKHPGICELRGRGLLLGLGLQYPNLATPDGLLPSIHLCNQLAEHGLLVPPAGPDTIRLLPPLNVKPEEVTHALAILRKVLDLLTND